VAVLGQHTHPAVAPIPLGPTTRERACRVLEQQLGAVWVAVLESHGFDLQDGWRITLEGLAVEAGPRAVHEGGELPVNGRSADAER
jgi:hypothetical protein